LGRRGKLDIGNVCNKKYVQRKYASNKCLPCRFEILIEVAVMSTVFCVLIPCKNLSKFWRNVLPPSSGSNSKSDKQARKKYIPLNHLLPHCMISHVRK
jgi:hypothetical protein